MVKSMVTYKLIKKNQLNLNYLNSADKFVWHFAVNFKSPIQPYPQASVPIFLLSSCQQ